MVFMKHVASCIVLTAVGADRPGLVNEISSVVHRAGANLEDAKMAILGGEFALLMLITGDPSSLETIEQSSAELENRLGLKVVTKRTERGHPHAGYLPYTLKVTGFDRPGIVHQVSELLARLDINVRMLESRVSFAPLSGTPMFILDAELQVPSAASLKQLRHGLEVTCEEVDLDFSLKATG